MAASRSTPRLRLTAAAAARPARARRGLASAPRPRPRGEADAARRPRVRRLCRARADLDVGVHRRIQGPAAGAQRTVRRAAPSAVRVVDARDARPRPDHAQRRDHAGAAGRLRHDLRRWLRATRTATAGTRTAPPSSVSSEVHAFCHAGPLRGPGVARSPPARAVEGVPRRRLAARPSGHCSISPTRCNSRRHADLADAAVNSPGPRCC